MVVHPGAGNTKKTLVNALIHKYKNNLSDVNGVSRPGIIHRIDKDTSGLLVVAKNNLSHSNLGKQFSEHSIKRKYKCLVWGIIRPLNGKIETFITRNKKNPKSEKKIDTNILKVQERIQKSLGLKVNILNKKNNSGKVSIEYKDLDQFQLVSDLLTKH